MDYLTRIKALIAESTESVAASVKGCEMDYLARIKALIAESTESVAAIQRHHESSESERDNRLADRLDSLRRLDLQHDELLRRTVQAEDRAGFLEEVHDDYKHLFDCYEKLIAAHGELLKLQMLAQQELGEIAECELQRTMLEGILEGCDVQKRIQAKKGAEGKAAKDPKRAEKRQVHECWQSWQKRPDSYKTKAEFARDMLEKCEHLVSQKKIEDWCREWERNAGTLPLE